MNKILHVKCIALKEELKKYNEQLMLFWLVIEIMIISPTEHI
jgi:hypothetical protein